MVFRLKICKKNSNKKINRLEIFDSFDLFNSKVPNLNKTIIVKTPPRLRLNLSRWVVPYFLNKLVSKVLSRLGFTHFRMGINL